MMSVVSCSCLSLFGTVIVLSFTNFTFLATFKLSRHRAFEGLLSKYNTYNGVGYGLLTWHQRSYSYLGLHGFVSSREIRIGRKSQDYFTNHWTRLSPAWSRSYIFCPARSGVKSFHSFLHQFDVLKPPYIVTIIACSRCSVTSQWRVVIRIGTNVVHFSTINYSAFLALHYHIRLPYFIQP